MDRLDKRKQKRRKKMKAQLGYLEEQEGFDRAEYMEAKVAEYQQKAESIYNTYEQLWEEAECIKAEVEAATRITDEERKNAMAKVFDLFSRARELQTVWAFLTTGGTEYKTRDY
jgi:hypothetical protein